MPLTTKVVKILWIGSNTALLQAMCVCVFPDAVDEVPQLCRLLNHQNNPSGWIMLATELPIDMSQQWMPDWYEDCKHNHSSTYSGKISDANGH